MSLPVAILRPVEGRRVRHPDGRLLAPEGEAVELGAYWLRRLDDGDAERAPPASNPKGAKA